LEACKFQFPIKEFSATTKKTLLIQYSQNFKFSTHTATTTTTTNRIW
jgi:hypothetical protein